MVKVSVSRRELKKIRAKASKKHDYSISNISISDYDSSLSGNSELYERKNHT